MNTAELMQAVEDAGCEFDCEVSGDLYRYLRRRDEIWVRLPAAFAWNWEDGSQEANNARLVINCSHYYTKTDDAWRIGSVYSHLEAVYDYLNEKSGKRIPVSIELNEGADPWSERERISNPGALTMFLRGLVDEARRMTKEIKAAQVQAAAKEYVL
jgi:hypothetical protein